uniref:Ribosomal protein S14P/S29E, putative n=1 Tax=Neospora caninum (strain Liverpool) TaxID=572307 RepID=A0A0F7U921_NEOCL|nr:TPA: ribosomal protein S14P/S29E, putative [Neospora caninum Liverpool]
MSTLRQHGYPVVPVKLRWSASMRHFFRPAALAWSCILALLLKSSAALSWRTNEGVTSTLAATGGVAQRHRPRFVSGAHLLQPSLPSTCAASGHNAGERLSTRVTFIFRPSPPSSSPPCFSLFRTPCPLRRRPCLRLPSSCSSFCSSAFHSRADWNPFSISVRHESPLVGLPGTPAFMFLGKFLGNSCAIGASSDVVQGGLSQNRQSLRTEQAAVGGHRRTALSMAKQRRYQLATDNLFVGLRDAQVQRNLRRKQMMIDYRPLRQHYKHKVAHATSMDERLDWHCRLQRLPRDSSPTRYRNRCRLCGRARGYFRFFGLCRHHVLDMVRNVMFPGFTKAEW